MKTGMRDRLWKETRALLPAWAMTLAIIIIGGLVLSNQNVMQIWFPYALGTQLVSALVFGHEFTDKTIGPLLAQPISRSQLWGEKMLVLAAALSGIEICLLLVVGPRFLLLKEIEPNDSNLAGLLLFLPVVTGWCSAPLMTLIMRGTLGGTALTILFPLVFALAALALNVSDQWIFAYTLATQSGYALICAMLGYFMFRSLEDKGSVSAVITTTALGTLTDKIAGGTGAIANLIKKELRLQQPVFLLAFVLFAFWVALMLIKWSRPMFSVEYLAVPAAILVVAVPALSGIITVAEERHLGLHDWHLTLPQSPRRQWLIKLGVGFLVNLLVGVVLAILLVLITQSAFRTTIAGENDWLVWLFLNLWIYSASSYASSFSPNSLRALLGLGFIACLMIGIWFLPTMIYSVSRQASFREVALILIPNLGFFWILGLYNFRRTLSSFSPLLGQSSNSHV
ncbi:MAG: hypothetical protein JWM99_5245, partial [Verrucomicrobiales bacterium]|nr:hypothetical protein [Verrucomicrobiales bacterium]